MTAPAVVVDPQVQFAPPYIGDAEVRAVVDVLRSGWLTSGPRVREFERQFAEYAHAQHAVAVSSCTAALHLSLIATGVGPGDDVVTSPLTFCATVNAIIQAGARPVFADIDLDTMNVSAAPVEDALTGRTAALLPVHFAGRPADVHRLRDLAQSRGAVLIEDAAHCIEGVVDGAKVGSIGDCTCFSFYSTKNLTTGEGGMVTTHSSAYAKTMRIAASHGISERAWSRHQLHRSADYDVVSPGFKYNMTDLQAALGCVQLGRIDQLRARRRAIWQRYDEALADLPVICPTRVAPGTAHAYHLYTILVERERCGHTREDLRQQLTARGVQTSMHFRALHLHPYYADRFGLRRGMFPNAEQVSDRTLSLPLSAGLSDADVGHVIATLRDLLT